MQYLVDDQSQFDAVCRKILEFKPAVYLDTEFVRKGRTFHAVLSCIQMAAELDNIRIIVDAFQVKDLTLFGQILADHEIMKVLHAPSEDFRIFLHLFKALPKNVFDTQCAASVSDAMGHGNKQPGNCIGYGKLCKALLNIEVDKSMQNADWEIRPLTAPMLNYAILDVEYLIPLRYKLHELLESSGKWTAYLVEIASTIMKPETYRPQPEKLIRRMCQETLNWYQRSEDQYGDIFFEEAELVRATSILTAQQKNQNGVPGKKGPAPKGGGLQHGTSNRVEHMAAGGYKGVPSDLVPSPGDYGLGAAGSANMGSYMEGNSVASNSYIMNSDCASTSVNSVGAGSCSTTSISPPGDNYAIIPPGDGAATAGPYQASHPRQHPVVGASNSGCSTGGGGSSKSVSPVDSTGSLENSSCADAVRNCVLASVNKSKNSVSFGGSGGSRSQAGVKPAAKPNSRQAREASFMRRFHALLFLREEEAMARDIPRQNCAPDEALMEVCCWLPTSNEELRECRRVNRTPLARDRSRELLLGLCQAFKVVVDNQQKLAAGAYKGSSPGTSNNFAGGQASVGYNNGGGGATDNYSHAAPTGTGGHHVNNKATSYGKFSGSWEEQPNYGQQYNW
ncbi:unnamed protein product [Amoebophrya sp. A25]|nr:unnamed protein product [Amoebophrya sp. A25]|eukprot:GSA25T00016562001.1